MKFYTKCCSHNTQKIIQARSILLDFRIFLSFTRSVLFLLPLASLFLLASCGGGSGGSRGAPGSAANLAIADSSAFEYAGSINFRVTLRAAADSTTSFYYRTKDDSAVAGSDYRAIAKSASIASGDIATTISVAIINDDDIEDEESFFVEILSSSSADTVIARATATIKIDDLPSLSIIGAVASEDARELEFIARLSAPFPGNIVSFDYETIAGSATQGDDYTGVASKTATIIADSTQISIPISIVNDGIDEGAEVFELKISNPVNATISQASALGIIKGEIASLFIADDSIPENTGVLKFIVILTRAVKQTVYFEYQTLTSSAREDFDYTRASGRASIPAGDTTAEISISIIDDQLVEDDESFFVEISSPTRGIFISRERATVTIRIDDLPKLSVADISVAENVGSLQFIASLSAPFPGHIVAFDYETIPSSASSNLDYTHVARRASIKAGELITSISIDIIDDLDVENDESFDLVISNPSNATIDKNRARATVTIEIDDLPILSIASVSVFENVEILKFVASLSTPFPGNDVSFDYQTRPSSASATSDYTSVSGRASILAGDTTTEIPIAIINDDDIEAAESFDLVISKLVNATISKPSATATIQIDELPILSVTDATALESAGSLQFVASLSEPFPGNDVSFDYETMPSSASRDLDYSHASARATILAGDTTTSILIAITNDTLVEADESFDVIISNPTNATIDKNRARATATIEIDDLPSLVIANVSASEDAGTLRFVARLSEPFGANVSFDYQTRAGSASSPSDYTSASGRASILAGDTTTEISISIINDGVNEGDEVFSLKLSNPVNATISKASALGIIEGKIASLFIADAAAFESELELRFVVTLSQTVNQNLSFSYSTIAGSATEGDDYTGAAAKTATIPAGSTTAEIIIALSDDAEVEDDETFDVEISTLSTEVRFSKERATGTIKIEDLPTLSIAGASAIESAGSLGFVVSLSEAFPGNEVSFFYSTLGGSAIARLDYTHFFARASIKADSTSITIPISIIDDVLVEADESFDVIIAQPLNATISTARATGIIEFDDLPTLSITGSSVIESAGSLKFTVFLSVPIIKDVSFDYQTLSGSASATSDYTSSSGNITIIAGSTTAEIFIDISDDTLVEADETFDLMITNPANATIDKNRASATATIEIDDLPRLSITGNSVIESAGSIKFLVTLSEPFPGNIVAFDYYTVQGSAIARLDYTHSFASASIKADSTSVSISISILDDVLVEADESFDVIIAQPINATISTARATGIIEFDDLPSLSVTGSSVIESEGSLRFRVFLSVPIMKDVSFDYQTLSGSASADYDYTSAFDTTSIPAGSKEISIFIDLIDDALIEDDETFDLVITNPDNAVIARARATATIKIDDLPTLSIAGSSVIESAESIKFLVTLSVPFPGNIVVFDYETMEGSAKNILDYTYTFARASILAGDTTTAIAIVIRNDSLIEEVETFDLVITNPINATIDKNRARATGRIEIDDLPSLSITGNSVVESAGTLLFTVSLSAPFSSTDVSFDYETIAGSASAGSDYLSTSARATIKAGSSTVEISVPIIPDNLDEGEEVFSLKLSNPVNATISKASALGIIEGEIASLFIADAAAFESELELRFVVTLSKAVSQNLSFSYSTIADSATQGDDYTGVTAGTVSIPAGETTAEIIIVLSDDAEVEDDEIFFVEISSVSSTEVRFSKERATGTIKIEDLPILSIANVTTLENAGSLQFIASLSEPFPGHLVSFDYETLGGSASAGLDYSYLLTTANIYPGNTTALINIIILDDDLVEDEETFDIIISKLANATIDQLKATATIKIDELPSLSITGSSVVESAGSAKFIVRLSPPFRITDVSFDYKTSPRSASDGADYTGVATRRATISAGDSTTAIFIAIIDDDTIEDYESFDVIISNPTNAIIDENRARATATIQIDELPSLSITGSSVIESAGSVKFIATLSPPFRSTEVSFFYSTIASSASDDLDYTGVALDTATISAGDSTTAIFIAIIDDELVEADESFDVIISNPTNATIDANKARATATIKIDDLPLLSIANVSASEDVGSLEFIAILSEPFDGYEISFNYETLSGSASRDDYTHSAASTIIKDGDTSIKIVIVINNDELVEDDETFDIIISNLVNATIDKARATATIKIDELPSLSITDAAALENAGSMQFIVTLSRAFSSTEVSFDYRTIVGSASDALDYTGVIFDTATINAGDSTTAIFIAIIDDELIEDDETFDLVIFNPVNAITGDNRATATIKIEDVPILSIADATVAEGGRSAKFIVTLSPPFRSTDVSFFYQTLIGSASEDDYTSVAFAPVTINAGDSTTAIFIVINDDKLVEEDESFDVMISNPTNATISKARATATIKIDELPILSVTGSSVAEDARSLKFIATLSAAFSRTDVSFFYQTLAGSASDGADYTGVALEAATINAGDSTTAIFITILDDELIEDDETFDLVIFNPNNATTGDNRATGTIKLDELPTLSIADATSLESAGSVKFIATLNPPFRSTDVSFFYQTLIGSASEDDYTSVAFAPATINAGDSTTAIFIIINDDKLVEEDESFDVIISNPTNATIDANKARATATIKLEDLPILSIAGAKDIESAGSLKFSVTLSAAFSRTDVSFYYETIADSATEVDDYTGVALTPVTIYATDTTATISIDIISDGRKEGDEFFSVRLSKPVNAKIINDTAQGIIDGQIPSLSIAGSSVAEDAGKMKFSVTLSKPVDNNIIFSYQTKAGSATDGEDYTGVATTSVTMPSPDTTAEIFITIKNDRTVEDDETFDVVISTNEPDDEIAISKESATGTIRIDELPTLSIADASALEGAEQMKFTATLSEAFSRTAVSFNYRTVGGSASTTDDYTGVTTQEARILAGDTTTEILISIIDDNVVEDDGSFDVIISNAVNATIDKNRARATATIINDDLPRLFIVNATAPEGKDASIKFSVTLDATFSRTAVSFNYRTEAGSASTDDYKSVAFATQTIKAGDSTTEISIDIGNDSLVEEDETFDLVIFNLVNATTDNHRATGTIIKDDFPFLSIADATALEGAGQMKFTATLSAAFSRTVVSFNYHTAGGSASTTDDYTGVTTTDSRRATIPAGDTTTEISITIVDDTVAEADEVFNIHLSSPFNALIENSNNVATGTIINDDLPSLSIADATALEGAGRVSTRVSVSAPLNEGLSFLYKTEAGSAKPIQDYEHSTNITGLGAYSDFRNISIKIIDDATIENDETFDIIISLHNSVNVVLGKARATITIINDDFPILSITDATALEGAGQMKFTATLSEAWRSTDVFFNYHTAGGSASTTDDYTGVTTTDSRRAMIAAGDTTTEIFIAIINDTTVENDETFDIVISNLVKVTTDNHRATATIINDDLPRLSIADVIVREDVGLLIFRVLLNIAFDKEVSFHYQTLGSSATDGDDYIGVVDTITIPVGSTTADIMITIEDDMLVEDDESFDIRLSNLANATAENNRATATIKIDELPILSITDAMALQSAGVMNFTVTLSRAFRSTDVSFDYHTIGITDSALAGEDYTEVTANSMTTASIPAGNTTTEISIALLPDLSNEGDEFFDVMLSSPVNAILSPNQNRARGTIEGEIPTLSITDATALENAGVMNFIVTLNRPTTSIVSYGIQVLPQVNHKYLAFQYTEFGYENAGEFIAIGETSGIVPIALYDDSRLEGKEVFRIELQKQGSNYALDPTRKIAEGIIIDDEPYTLSISDSAVTEGAGKIRFSLTRNNFKSLITLSVFWRTRDGSALAGEDYTAASGTVLFPPNDIELSRYFEIELQDDNLIEDDETFDVVITTGAYDFIVIKDTAIGTIRNNDVPNLFVADATALEGEDMQFSVTLDATFSQDISFSYYTLAGSALAGADYTEVTANSMTTASIPAGSTSVSIAIPIISDAVVEGSESFFLVLTEPVNVTLANPRATGTIKGLATIHITSSSALESEQELRFVAQLESPFAEEVSFSYYTLAGSALAGADYTEVTANSITTASIPAGSTSVAIVISIIDDATVENDETFDIRLSNPVNAILGQAQATATIINDDRTSLSVADAAATEGDQHIQFTVTLSKPSPNFVSFDYETRGVSANTVLDYDTPTVNTNQDEQDIREHTSVVFKNKMWVLGGSSSSGNGINNENNVLSFTNTGIATNANANNHWSARHAHSSVVFDNKMWVLGGSTGTDMYRDYGNSHRNDVYSSTNGTAWNVVKTNNNDGWQARRSHSSLVFKDKMWVLGGYAKHALADASLRNDVYSSTNGRDWTNAEASNHWSTRHAHSSVVFDNKMWVLGGLALGDHNQNDVWDSTNGTDWTNAGASNHWSARKNHTSVVYEGKIWVFGGQDDMGTKKDVWYSTDGVTWSEESIPSSSRVSVRREHTSVVFDGKMWLLGGVDNSGTLIKFGYLETQGDYTSQSARVSIPPRATSKTLTINLTDDTVAEPTETFELIISNPTNAPIDPARSKATGTIQDDD